MLDVVVISPHPDDAELGMAGAILQLKADGFSVGVLDLTSGEPTPFGSPEIRARETAAATEILGLDWRENLGLHLTEESEFANYVLSHLPEMPMQYVEIKRVNIGLSQPDEEEASELELGKNVCALSDVYAS